MHTGSLTFGLHLSLQNPYREPAETRLRESLELITWAEGAGFGSVWLAEHHFTEDGYLPSPLTIAGALCARTSSMRVGTSLAQAPYYHPVRLAEDAAMLSILSEGRFDLGLGLGYREVEYAAFGKRIRHRPSLIEECVQILRLAWSGTSIKFAGKRYTIPDVTVSPLPATSPRIFLGGHSAPAIRRAALLGDGYLPSVDAHVELFEAACRAIGREPSLAPLAWTHGHFVIGDDPEKTFNGIAEYLMNYANPYLAWGEIGRTLGVETQIVEDPWDLVRMGLFKLLDTEQAVDAIVDRARRFEGLQDVHIWERYPGEPVDSAHERLEHFINRVAPRVRAALTAT